MSAFPWMFTIEQNLDDFMVAFMAIPGENFHEMRDALLKRLFGIYEKKKVMVSQLSAGQITRLMLVQAFMVKPKIVTFR